MSARSQEVVYRKSTRGLIMNNVNTLPDHTACDGWVDATNMLQKLLATQSATVSHVCARSLLRPCSIVPSTSSCHKRFVASRSRSTLSVGSHAAHRLVPVVLTLQALLACWSRHRHRCRIRHCPQHFRESVCCVRLRWFLDHR